MDIGSLNAFGQIRVAGVGSLGAQVKGTFSGTLTFTASINGIEFFPIAAENAVAPGVAVLTATAPGLFRFVVAGYCEVRFTMTAYTSGLAQVICKTANPS